MPNDPRHHPHPASGVHAQARGRRIKWPVVLVGGLGVLVTLLLVRGCGGGSASGQAKEGWLHDFAEAQRQARAAGKPILADFYADWCGPCRRMDAEVLPDPQVAALIREHFIAVKVDMTGPGSPGQPIGRRYGIRAYPTFLVLAPDGARVDGAVGFQPAQVFLKWLQPLARRYPAAPPPASQGAAR